jgi:hypothetical protein
MLNTGAEFMQSPCFFASTGILSHEILYIFQRHVATRNLGTPYYVAVVSLPPRKFAGSHVGSKLTG